MSCACPCGLAEIGAFLLIIGWLALLITGSLMLAKGNYKTGWWCVGIALAILLTTAIIVGVTTTSKKHATVSTTDRPTDRLTDRSSSLTDTH